MVDYSKFDNIGDSSDEEPAKASFAPPQRQPEPRAPAPAPVPRGRNGREILEPIGLESKLAGLASPGGDEMAALEAEFQRLSGGAGSPALHNGSEAQQKPQQAKPGEPTRLCVHADGRKKVHTTWPDGREMVEEFDEKTDVLLLRKTRASLKTLGREAEWIFEVGQAPVAQFDPSSDLVQVSAGNPIFLRKDTPEHFQWRIRNLAYPVNVYSVTNDHDKQQIVVRTSNKKYFKRIDVPDLARAGLKLRDELLTWKHQHNTLIISYARPPEVAAMEQKTLQLAEQQSVKL